jgi:uncharacterized protein (TIGR01370 family)
MIKRLFPTTARPGPRRVAAFELGRALLASAVVGAALLPAPWGSSGAPAQAAASARERIKAVKSYVIYYDGKKRLDKLAARLAPYDLAILNTNHLTAQEISDLKSAGKLLVSYVSVGEIGRKSPLLKTAKAKGWLLGGNRDWKSHYVNVTLEDWHQQVRGEVDDILRKGYHGVFLDTVDTVDVEKASVPKEKLAEGMIRLIRRLRADHPDMLIIQNRGFTVISETAKEIDAAMYEDFSTGYSFSANSYKPFDPGKIEKNGDRVSFMSELGKRMPVLALDYAKPGDAKTACAAVQAARRCGFIPAVSVGTLNDLPDYKLGQCPAAPGKCVPGP